MMEERDRRQFLKRLRAPALENPQKMKILKQIATICKKYTTCPFCLATNGTVKKVGVLKLVHEKYRAKSKEHELQEFRSSFHNAMVYLPEIKQHIPKAQDDLNPQKVYDLLKNMTAEDCQLLGMDPEYGRPEQFIWTALPVPPVCIRPSVAMDRGEMGR
jgi:DNA-directed RNA polymerase III subunit RPC1